MLPRFQLAVILAASIFFGIGSILRAQDVGGGMVVTISGGGMASGPAVSPRRPRNPAAHRRARSSSPATRMKPQPVATDAMEKAAVAIDHANAERDAKRFGEAEQSYRLASSLDPQNASAQAGLGNVYFDQARYSIAAEAYEKAISVDPDDAQVYANLGYSYAQLKRWNEAIKALQESVRLEPHDYWHYIYLAWAYNSLTRAAEAAEAAQKAIGLQPDEYIGHAHLSWAYIN